MAIGDIRPFVDGVALATKGIKTTYRNGTLRDFIDKVALATQGVKTTYMQGEEDLDIMGRIIYIFNDARLLYTYNDARIPYIIGGS